MKKIKLDKNLYYREYNLCSISEMNKIKKDIDTEIDQGNIAPNVPKYQTYSNLYNRYKSKKHWYNLYKKIKKPLEKIYKQKLVLFKSWANISTSVNNYGVHSHKSFLTCVYYLKSKYPHYGTILTNEQIIIPAIENSLLVFNGKIKHSISNLPSHLFKGIDDYRYSIVFDFDKLK